ncbi:hypothetical protein TOT_040000610 [Theileria orientalis strain Shintoku]|uniref:Uncharacterized protein n=1 Tax=Theileria orientalis strain Shintoku TaxID=869250 RepID=J4DAX4_THEOR|nr:hypothetical protein TOT_040000610 [Theileria orientalis strain Shintoku]PVC51470.1 hypothetical protein MACL_00001547 [Theileria orientalis]BAM42240.1 hypothetical protein TOT_040000610 [Theileria orientalis strain Shintoku]|eukprot:XP_009692541.1 hypothetical protein TOT_040000610 [Theileria orientalis strain Shintoku]
MASRNQSFSGRLIGSPRHSLPVNFGSRGINILRYTNSVA